MTRRDTLARLLMAVGRGPEELEDLITPPDTGSPPPPVTGSRAEEEPSTEEEEPS